MDFPAYRPRRLRRNEKIRELVRETTLSPKNFIYPIFVGPGKNRAQPVSSMPGISQLSVDRAVKECEEAQALGVPAIILFGVPEHKDSVGTEGYAETGVVQQAIRAVKERVPGLLIMTDVCLCEYTDHGHCGVIKNGDVDNDSTLELLVKEALSHARAGADVVAPSDMMDGRVGAIRKSLDQNGFEYVAIMAYAAKYASGFYGPFREAAESTPQFGDRRSYQMDPANADEALREVELDIREGADIVMVKPAMAYLDIVYRVKQKFGYPVAAYNVSGEYSMIKAAGRNGWIDEERIMMEVLFAIRRAGADMKFFASPIPWTSDGILSHPLVPRPVSWARIASSSVIGPWRLPLIIMGLKGSSAPSTSSAREIWWRSSDVINRPRSVLRRRISMPSFLPPRILPGIAKSISLFCGPTRH